MDIAKVVEETRNRVERNPMWYILSAAFLLRLPFFYSNSDGRVYALWLTYFMNTLKIPYPDHPPVFFLLSGGSVQFSHLLQNLGFGLSIVLVFFVIAAIWRVLGAIDLEARVFLSALTLYSALVLTLGSFYEVASLPSLFAGLGTVYLLYRFSEWRCGREVAVVSALLLSFSWWHIVYSRTLLIDAFAAFTILWGIYEYSRYIEGEGNLWRTTLVLTVAFYSKYYALLILPIIGIYSVLKTRELGKLSEWALPGIAAGLMFMPWLVITEFYMFNHFASTHYLLIELPSIMAFVRSYWLLLTPLGFLLVLAGTTVYRKIGALPFLVFGVPYVYFIVTTYTDGVSHPLVNQSNYMLFTLPFLLFIGAAGWKQYVDLEGLSHSLVILLLALTLSFPLFHQTITLEYGEDYQAHRGNFNMVSPDETIFSPPEVPTIHFVYSFDRVPSLLGEVGTRDYHVRWMSPDTARILGVGDGEEDMGFAVFLESNTRFILNVSTANGSWSYSINRSTTISPEIPMDEGFIDLKFDLYGVESGLAEEGVFISE